MEQKLKDIAFKQTAEAVVLIKHLQVMQAKDGRKYLNIVATDGDMDLECRVWNDAEKWALSFERGSVAIIKGRMNLFQGRKQFIIGEILPAPEGTNPNDFRQKAETNPEEMFTKLKEIVLGLDDVYIKDLLVSVLEDKEIGRRLKVWQAGKSIHHAYQSGLLEHILSCAELSVTLSKHYNVNKNYVVAGAILHDLCKIYELTDGASVEYTEEGKLVGHLVKGLEIVDRFTYKMENFPRNTKMHLKHILLSHHGEYEYGSPKIPQTREAMLVHLIDNMDSKMNVFETIIKQDNNSGHWSGFVKHMDRIVFKDELPFYPEYEKPLGTSTSNQEKPAAVKKTEKPKRDKEIKQNLSALLKDFKVD